MSLKSPQNAMTLVLISLVRRESRLQNEQHIKCTNATLRLPCDFDCISRRSSRLHKSCELQHCITTDSFRVLVVEQLKGCSMGIKAFRSIQLHRKWNHHICLVC